MTVNGLARFEVRVPVEVRKQENATRRYLAREAEAKAYCLRLASDLRNYPGKARGLTDARKIMAGTLGTKPRRTKLMPWTGRGKGPVPRQVGA